MVLSETALPYDRPVVGRHRTDQSRWLWAAAAILVLLATTAAAWAEHLSDEGRVVAENVWYAGDDLSRLASEQAAALVVEREEEVLTTAVGIDTGDGRLLLPAGELGFGYDTEAALKAILSVRHTGGPWVEIADFFSGPFRRVTVDDFVTFDAEAAFSRLSDDPRMILQDPVEPTIGLDGGELVVTPGDPGRQIDLSELTSRLALSDVTDGPIEVDIGQGSIPPTVSDEAATIAAGSLNSVTGGGADILVGTADIWVSGPQLREHITAEPIAGSVRVTFDTVAFRQSLERMLPDPVAPFRPPQFEVNGNGVEVVGPGEIPPVCCDQQSVQQAVDSLMAGAAGPYRVDPRPSEDPRHIAWAMGTDVTEKVAEFTTRHGCCEARVTNIHRIADIVRGAYLRPGETISLNEYVGPRTRAKGFVPAGAIRFGRLNPEVGGGVSQFATTIFNAAYFAGLELVEYRSHSLYFDRYPFGREATISDPHPDLVFGNTTQFPVLFWTSYTGTSITVSVFSTNHIEVEELDQRVYRRDLCRHVETDRQRTYPDGRVVVDTIEADYRPAEGIDCNGNPIPIPPGA
jgi:vancomycin resistance protein YoaR